MSSFLGRGRSQSIARGGGRTRRRSGRGVRPSLGGTNFGLDEGGGRVAAALDLQATQLGGGVSDPNGGLETFGSRVARSFFLGAAEVMMVEIWLLSKKKKRKVGDRT